MSFRSMLENVKFASNLGRPGLRLRPRPVPIKNTGEVPSYDVTTGLDQSFIAAGGLPGLPWHLTFGQTKPAALGYDD